MRVSFGAATESNAMIKVRQEVNINETFNGIAEEQTDMIAQHSQLTRVLAKERDEARKREEALRDRLALQEARSDKQVHELKTQLRKLQSESARPQRIREPTASPSTGRSERKRDVKSRDVRELQITIANLKSENKVLEEKLQKLTDFVKVAGEIKNQAIGQCTLKEEEIENLQRELKALENVYDEEMQRRIKKEAETHSLRAYVDYLTHKRRKNLKQKSVQTETSVPPKFIIGDRTEITPSATSGFASLKATAASWRLKNLEKEHREETRRSKQKFDGAQRGDSISSGERQTRKSLPDFRKQEPSSSSTSESERNPLNYRKPPIMTKPRTERLATRPKYPQGRSKESIRRRQTHFDPPFGATVA